MENAVKQFRDISEYKHALAVGAAVISLIRDDGKYGSNTEEQTQKIAVELHQYFVDALHHLENLAVKH